MSDDVKQLEPRLNKVEAELSTVVTAVGELTQSVTAINTNLNHVSQSVSNMTKSVDYMRTQKTPWSILIGFAGLFITIWSISMVPIYYRLAKSESRLIADNTINMKQAELNGYQRAINEFRNKE